MITRQEMQPWRNLVAAIIDKAASDYKSACALRWNRVSADGTLGKPMQGTQEGIEREASGYKQQIDRWARSDEITGGWCLCDFLGVPHEQLLDRLAAIYRGSKLQKLRRKLGHD